MAKERRKRSPAGPLNILFVQDFPCIRNYKMATALRSCGHRVTLAYMSAPLSRVYEGLSDDTYDACIQLSSCRHLWDLSAEFDIVHCHNEPDHLTVAALAGSAPVVHDTHDLISLRASGDKRLAFFEGIANRGSDGRIYCTEGLQEEANELYGVEGPSIVFRNYALKADLPRTARDKLSATDGKTHVVYEGSIGGGGHRDFVDLFADMSRYGVHIHVYPTLFDEGLARVLREFETIHYHRPKSPKVIIEEMTQYDVGIIPFNVQKGNKRFLDTSIANKFYEYLAAGLPILASSLHSYGQLLDEYPVGDTFLTADEAVSKLAKLTQIARTTDLTRYVKTYEDEIGAVVALYRSVISGAKTRLGHHACIAE